MIFSSASSERLIDRSAIAQSKLAQIWQEKGKIDRAVEGYQKALAIQPDYLQAHLKLASLYTQQQKFDELLILSQQALQFHPNQSEFHKNLVNAFVGQDRLVDAFKYYRLNRRDKKDITIAPESLVCCLAVRNESLRLPYFLQYYREKGVDRFLIVDNNSTDDTLNYLLQQPDVYLWHSTYSFNRVNFGSAWFEVLLRKYALNRWCLMVDADELLYYPACEHKTIVDLCQELDKDGKRVFAGILLDMYSDKTIIETEYQSGEDFREVCPYFDRQFCHRQEYPSPYNNLIFSWGGARERIFGRKGGYLLSKIPLIKYDRDCILAGGQHWTNLDKKYISSSTGCLLHFKYFASFTEYVNGEVNRKEHYGDAFQYRQYAQKIDAEKRSFSLYSDRHSVKLIDSEQLSDLGVIKK